MSSIVQLGIIYLSSITSHTHTQRRSFNVVLTMYDQRINIVCIVTLRQYQCFLPKYYRWYFIYANIIYLFISYVVMCLLPSAYFVFLHRLSPFHFHAASTASFLVSKPFIHLSHTQTLTYNSSFFLFGWPKKRKD